MASVSYPTGSFKSTPPQYDKSPAPSQSLDTRQVHSSPLLSTPLSNNASPSSSNAPHTSPSVSSILPVPHYTLPNKFHSNHPMQTRSKNGIYKHEIYTATLSSCPTQEPDSISKALQNPIWKRVMQDEIYALHNNNT